MAAKSRPYFKLTSPHPALSPDPTSTYLDLLFTSAFSANLQGGLKGALVALGICAPGAYLLQRQSPTFRALPIPLKAFAAVVVTVPCISIGAEKAGEKYERGILGVNKLESEREERELQRWERLGGMEKVQDWSRRNQWSLVGGR